MCQTISRIVMNAKDGVESGNIHGNITVKPAMLDSAYLIALLLEEDLVP